MQKTIKSIQIFSLARILACVNAFVGLVIGLFLTLAHISGQDAMALGVNNPFGVYAVLGYPIANALGGFLGGLLVGSIYNIFAARFGGIQMEIEE